MLRVLNDEEAILIPYSSKGCPVVGTSWLSSTLCLLRNHSTLICPISCLRRKTRFRGTTRFRGATRFRGTTRSPFLFFVTLVDDFLVQNMCLSLIALL